MAIKTGPCSNEELLELTGIVNSMNDYRQYQKEVDAYIEGFRKKYASIFDELILELRTSYRSRIYTARTQKISFEFVTGVAKVIEQIKNQPQGRRVWNILSEEGANKILPTYEQLEVGASNDRIRNFIRKMQAKKIDRDTAMAINGRIDQNSKNTIFYSNYSFSDEEIEEVIACVSNPNYNLKGQDADCLLEAIEQGLRVEEMGFVSELLSLSVQENGEELVANNYRLVKDYMNSQARRETYNLSSDYTYSYWLVDDIFSRGHEKVNKIELVRAVPEDKRGYVMFIDEQRMSSDKTRLVVRAICCGIDNGYVKALINYAYDANVLNLHILLNLIVKGLKYDELEAIIKVLENENKDGYNYNSVSTKLQHYMSSSERRDYLNKLDNMYEGIVKQIKNYVRYIYNGNDYADNLFKKAIIDNDPVSQFDLAERFLIFGYTDCAEYIFKLCQKTNPDYVYTDDKGKDYNATAALHYIELYNNYTYLSEETIRKMNNDQYSRPVDVIDYYDITGEYSYKLYMESLNPDSYFERIKEQIYIWLSTRTHLHFTDFLTKAYDKGCKESEVAFIERELEWPQLEVGRSYGPYSYCKRFTVDTLHLLILKHQEEFAAKVNDPNYPEKLKQAVSYCLMFKTLDGVCQYSPYKFPELEEVGKLNIELLPKISVLGRAVYNIINNQIKKDDPRTIFHFLEYLSYKEDNEHNRNIASIIASAINNGANWYEIRRLVQDLSNKPDQDLNDIVIPKITVAPFQTKGLTYHYDEDNKRLIIDSLPALKQGEITAYPFTLDQLVTIITEILGFKGHRFNAWYDYDDVVEFDFNYKPIYLPYGKKDRGDQMGVLTCNKFIRQQIKELVLPEYTTTFCFPPYHHLLKGLKLENFVFPRDLMLTGVDEEKINNDHPEYEETAIDWFEFTGNIYVPTTAYVPKYYDNYHTVRFDPFDGSTPLSHSPKKILPNRNKQQETIES